MTTFILNHEKISTDLPSGSLLLDFIRYSKSLKGTKIGCREGDCGACSVLVGKLTSNGMKYEQVTSCLTPLGNIANNHVVTIEGLNMDNLSPVQEHMINESGTQCGFCTVGFVVSLTSFCMANQNATYEQAIASIDGNICRCTGYKSIERAAKKITTDLSNKNTDDTINWLIENQYIPAYFNGIPNQIKDLELGHTKQIGQIVGGGTDLYVQKHGELIDKQLVHINKSEELKFIKVENDHLHIGGGTTVTEFAESSEIKNIFPNLDAHIKLVSSSLIRNISTFAGNFVNASPIGDFTIFFIALNASITIENDTSKREILLKDLYKGYKDLAMEKDELIGALSFPIPSPNTRFNLEKVSKRTHLDIASVNSALSISSSGNNIESISVSCGGVGPTPMMLEKTSAFLTGKVLSAANLKLANETLQEEINPISDVRGSEKYKRLLLRQLFYAHFLKLFPTVIKLEDLT
jgi:xanthine dehydrogenase small subunit